MVVCPNCRAENRSGAKYCKTCATRLPTSPLATRPLDPGDLEFAAAAPAPAPSGAATRRLAPNPRSGTRPLQPPGAFLRRPAGALFQDNFLLDRVVFSDDHQHRYQVHQVNVAEDMQIHVCPNADCGAVFLPRNAAPEKFCTDCGTLLERGGADLLLVESRAPLPENLVRAAAKGLSHGAVRAPLAAFVERLAGIPRHCMVLPRVAPLEPGAEAVPALRRAIGLARGLEYLHDNGVGFDGRLDAGVFGQVGGRAVWANFIGCVHHPDGYVADRKPDADALARLVYQWLTGKTSFDPKAGLPAPAAHAFEAALAEAGVQSGLELSDLFERALEELTSVRAIDFIMGRRTHVGMVRTLNEDSIMSLEINRIQQSISRPLGVYLVADGMGGHAAGEVASGTIINTIARKALTDLMPDQVALGDAHDQETWLRQAVEAANSEIFKMRQSTGNDMGSTLVAVVLDGSKAYITHIGDSRAYLINAQGIQRLTVDHSLVERLIASNQITRDEARYHPQRNVIYRTVGDKAGIDVDVAVHTLSVGDSLLLCSDGLSGMVEDARIHRIVLEAASPQDACDRLIRAANDAGGEDNISAILVKIVEA